MTKVVLGGMSASMLEAAQAIKPPDVEVILLPRGLSEPERAAIAGQADLFFGSHRIMSIPLLEAMAGYRLVQLTGAGYDYVDIPTARRLKLPVANNGGANSVGVAEHAIMLMLACVKFLIPQHQLVSQGGWQGVYGGGEEPVELEGKTVGLLGLGSIGQKVARRLMGWDCRVVYYDPFRQSSERERELSVEYLPLDELLGTADIVSLHLPLNEQTHHFINARTLAQMKKGSVLINTARGGLVNDADVAAALGTRLFAAGLDVLGQEPPDKNNPLLTAQNVVLTAHMAGNTRETWHKTAVIGWDNVRRVIEGKRPLYLIPEVRDLF